MAIRIKTAKKSTKNKVLSTRPSAHNSAAASKQKGGSGLPGVSARRENIYKAAKKSMVDKDPIISYTSRIRQVGNSKGVIFNNDVIKAAGIAPNADVVINAGKGVIYIFEVKPAGVNTDISTWDKQFKAAINKGTIPEGDLFDGLGNEFDQKEW
ncbi:MAG TPA: hypothetical protein VGD17_09210 [Chitinophagaceae bacterium]